jgi:hypothetical protein
MIAGSTLSKNSTTYNTICKNIANTIVSEKFEVVLGSERDNTADKKIIDTLISLNKKVKVTMYYHDNKPKPFFNDGNVQKSKIDIQYRKLKGDWSIGRAQQINDSDAVIIIGGSTKTNDIIDMCKNLNKLIIPIPCEESQSASDNYWDEFKNKYNNSFTQINAIENWTKGSPKQISKFIKREVQLSKYDAIALSQLIPYIIIVFLAVLLWFLIISQKIVIIDDRISIVCLTFISSFLAVNAENTFQITHNHYINLKEFLLIKPLHAMLVSTLLIIVYITSAYSINGDLSIFLTKLSEEDNYIRIALSLALLGMLAGLKSEVAMQKVFNKIEDTDLSVDK